jgi:hypothetical protein
MSAQPAQAARRPAADRETAGGRPFLKLHRCRLDYDAALREHLRGGCASRVARAAGSRATSQRNLRRVGLKIVARLERRYDVLATFDRLGLTIEEFCRSVIAQLQAVKIPHCCYKGDWIFGRPLPDWRARAAACRLYLLATGILDLPP